MKTNRNYLSWSQYSLWKSSKLQFYKRYVLGETGPILKAWDKGTEFSNYKETGEIPIYVTDPLLKQVADEVPSLDIMEYKLEVKIGEYNLLSYIDSCDFELNEFLEYKTGKDEWNQTLVNKHEQLDFYALCIYIKSNETILPKCTLYWIEVEDIEMTDGSIEKRYTGRIEKFEREFTEEDMVVMMSKIINVLKEIENYEHVELELEENLVDRYIKLSEKAEKIKKELDIIKLEVHNTLKLNDVKYGVTAKGKFSISERSNYSYSAELNNKEADYKAEIDELKRIEKNNGTAKVSKSESLLFKIIKQK